MYDMDECVMSSGSTEDTDERTSGSGIEKPSRLVSDYCIVDI
jgi:hypothetical protein